MLHVPFMLYIIEINTTFYDTENVFIFYKKIFMIVIIFTLLQGGNSFYESKL